MKNVSLIVEMTDEKGRLAYAIKYTGVMTRRNIYAKLVQDTGCLEPEYIRVSKFDTIDKTKDWKSIISGERFLHIVVPHDIGMNDSRIHKIAKLLLPYGILKAVNDHVQEEEDELNKLLAGI